MPSNHYFYIDEVQKGPFTLDKLVKEPVNEDTFIWAEGFDDWKKISEVPEVFSLLRPKQTPPPFKEHQISEQKKDTVKSDIQSQLFQSEKSSFSNKSIIYILMGVIGVIVILILFKTTNISNTFKSNTEKIIGDWELVSLEATSSGQTTSDKFSDLAANSLNSMLESMKIIYSFSGNKEYMTYGTLRGLKELSEALFMVQTAKRGRYEIDGDKLTTVGDDGTNIYEIVELDDKVMKLKTQDNQVMVFNITSKEIEQQKSNQQNEYSTLIIGKWKCCTLEYDNQEHNVENQNIVLVYEGKKWYNIRNGINDPSIHYNLKGNRIVSEGGGDEIVEIIELNNTTLKIKANSKSENMVDVVSTFKRVE